MTLKTQTSRRGLTVTAAVAVAVVAAGVVATAMQSDGNGTAVEQGQGVQQGAPAANAPQGDPAPTGPGFLAPAELPQGKEFGAWTAQGATSGLPEPPYTCMADVLPVASTWYQKFSSDMNAEAREFVTVLDDAAGAELIAKEAAQSIERCADTMKAKDDGKDTTWKKYGSYADPADGLAVYGVFFAPPNSEYHLQMYGVGRDGNKVVLVALGMQGRESEAPVDAFTATARTALDKAF